MAPKSECNLCIVQWKLRMYGPVMPTMNPKMNKYLFLSNLIMDIKYFICRKREKSQNNYNGFKGLSYTPKLYISNPSNR
jgi:hypothetical protein